MSNVKNSNIKWIGDIPKDWDIVKVKELFQIGRGRVIAKTEIDEEGLYPVYSSQTKHNGCLGYISTYDYDIAQLTWTTDGANAGTVFIREGKHNCTNVCGTLVPKSNDNNLMYLKYCLEYIAKFHKRADINGFKIMNNEMANIDILRPNSDTQKKIVDLLDEKCKELDSIINKTKSSIREYNNLKCSLITDAVTKGVNGSKNMKNAGVEWIENIPTNWDLKKFKNLVSSNLQYGANSSGEEFKENLPRYIRITDITLDNKLKNENMLSLSEEESKQFILDDNDILFARSGATVGKSFIYKDYYGKSAFAGYLIRAKVNKENDPNFVYYYTLSSCYNEWKNRIFIQATIQNIGASKYANMEIPVPSLEEQKEIVYYLDNKCNEIDNLISKKQEILTELESYKQSLIFEYVTGKKENKNV